LSKDSGPGCGLRFASITADCDIACRLLSDYANNMQDAPDAQSRCNENNNCPEDVREEPVDVVTHYPAAVHHHEEVDRYHRQQDAVGDLREEDRLDRFESQHPEEHSGQQDEHPDHPESRRAKVAFPAHDAGCCVCGGHRCRDG